MSYRKLSNKLKILMSSENLYSGRSAFKEMPPLHLYGCFQCHSLSEDEIWQEKMHVGETNGYHQLFGTTLLLLLSNYSNNK